MSAPRVSRCCAALCLSLAGLAVPAAAQSSSQPLLALRDDHSTWRTAPRVVRTYLEDDGPPTPSRSAMPANVVIAESYRDTFEWMLQSSGAFRRQCARIARAADLQVVIERSLVSAPASGEARTRITRRSDGRLSAIVELGYMGDAVLLIAHEFEHILEQLDGVDLATMAARPATGVRVVSSSGVFETDRAIEAGRQVAAEVYAVGRRREP